MTASAFDREAQKRGARGASRWFAWIVGVGVLVGLGASLATTHPRERVSDVPVSRPGGVLGGAVADLIGDPGVRSSAAATTTARAAVVIDASTGEILFERGAFDVHPIASLTKFMSAMVALDQGPDLGARAQILPTEYTIRGGNLRIGPHEDVTVRDLLFASITGSANNAAFALPRVLGFTDESFIQEMNRKAIALGLETLHFTDAAGLDPDNIGSAYDVARLAAHAFMRYPVIAEAARASEYRFLVHGTERAYEFRSSNPLRAQLPPETESKTAYLNEALYCLVLTRNVEGRRLVAVLLGHPLEEGVVRDALVLLDAAAARSENGDSSHGAASSVQ